MNMALAITVLGVLLTAVGLVALWPSMVVDACPPTDQSQPFSVPFKITNTGYLPVKNVKIYCYAHRVRVGPIDAQSNLMSNSKWSTSHLGRGESITIIANFVKAPVLPAEADMAIISDFNSFGAPFLKLRSLTRFVGHFGETWQWLKQPSHEVKAAAARMIDRAK